MTTRGILDFPGLPDLGDLPEIAELEGADLGCKVTFEPAQPTISRLMVAPDPLFTLLGQCVK